MGVIMDGISSNNQKAGDSGRRSLNQDYAETSGKLHSWKSRFSAGRNRSTSDLGNYESQPNTRSMQSGATINSSLASQRHKTKKNWKGNIKNLLTHQKKVDFDEDPTPHAQEVQDTVSRCRNFSLSLKLVQPSKRKIGMPFLHLKQILLTFVFFQVNR
jgi:hypothetical protein